MEPLNIISLGLGVQSTCLYFMSSLGELPRADYAIFADTGKERTATYAYLRYLQAWQHEHNGIPILVCNQRNLYQDLLSSTNTTGDRFASIPCFTKNDDGGTGMLRRQCTGEYKITPVNTSIRDLYGLRKGQHRPPTFVWQGITLDEIERMAHPKEKWKISVYPFTGYMFYPDGRHERLPAGTLYNRHDLTIWYENHNLPMPTKSACVFCPYQSDRAWLQLKTSCPEDFMAAVQVDNAIRRSASKGVRNPCYLHRSLKPLSEVVFNPHDAQQEIECSGTCHV